MAEGEARMTLSMESIVLETVNDVCRRTAGMDYRETAEAFEEIAARLQLKAMELQACVERGSQQ